MSNFKGAVLIGSSTLHTAHNMGSSFYNGFNLQGTWSQSVEIDTLIIIGEFNIMPYVSQANADTTVTVEIVSTNLSILSTVVTTADTNVCDVVDLVITASKVFNEITKPYPEVFADTSAFTIKKPTER